jgi:hypothetical protein
MSENMNHTKLPKIVRATTALFIGLSMGSYHSLSEDKDRAYEEIVIMWGLPFITFSVCALVLSNNELYTSSNAILQLWFRGIFYICYPMGFLSLIGMIVQVVMLPFNIWKQLKKLI